MPLILHNATLIDGTGADQRTCVSAAVEDGRIAGIASGAAQSLASQRRFNSSATLATNPTPHAGMVLSY